VAGGLPRAKEIPPSVALGDKAAILFVAVREEQLIYQDLFEANSDRGNWW
jgi:hypothetical protein